MKKLLIIAGLVCGLAGLTANAQMAPSPTDPHQQPGASTPGTPPTFPTDRQESPSENRKDNDADSQQTDKDRQDQTDRDPQTSTDPNQTGSERQRTDPNDQTQRTDRDDQNTQQRTDRDYDRDRNTGSTSGNVGSNAGQQDDRDRDHDGDTDHRSDYQSQLQNALQQQPDLAGVQATFTDSTLELTGTVPTGKEKHQARMLAQNYANGRKIVDHITVTGKGHER
jgi:hypothetical protein